MLIWVKDKLSSVYILFLLFSVSLNFIENLDLKIDKKCCNGRPLCLSVHVLTSWKSLIDEPGSYTNFMGIRYCDWQPHQGPSEMGRIPQRIQSKEHPTHHNPLCLLSSHSSRSPRPSFVAFLTSTWLHLSRPYLLPKWHQTRQMPLNK